MEIVKEGTEFKLDNFNNDSQQILKFTQKLPDGKYTNGTTNEEVINALIERFYYLQKTRYSSENQHIIILLKDIRRLLYKRLQKKVQNVKEHNESINNPSREKGIREDVSESSQRNSETHRQGTGDLDDFLTGKS